MHIDGEKGYPLFFFTKSSAWVTSTLFGSLLIVQVVEGWFLAIAFEVVEVCVEELIDRVEWLCHGAPPSAYRWNRGCSYSRLAVVRYT